MLCIVSQLLDPNDILKVNIVEIVDANGVQQATQYFVDYLKQGGLQVDQVIPHSNLAEEIRAFNPRTQEHLQYVVRPVANITTP